ncbi:unnamed protein product [Diatraea saccharalis]|uniref:Uncharacterized protein n=1 Tax=Diatraea saccharalis TaxID=40085 RepID=A0A9N9RFU3_9NEOP|nr:unnamed protein product [Diatraea saccharalis]
MKLLILMIAISWSSAAKLDKTYLPPRTAQSAGGSGNFLRTPHSGHSVPEYQENNGFSQADNGFPDTDNGFAHGGNGYNNGNSFEGRPERAQAAYERNAAIVRQNNENDGETYHYAYETENGISAEERGVATNGVEAQGGYSYTGDDGQVYSIRYTADQNGFVPEGDHLPTPPPVPIEILNALEQNARDEAAGIYDDGSYNEAKYGGGADEYNNGNSNNYNNNVYNNIPFKNNEYQGDEDSVVTNSALFRNSPRPAYRDQDFNGAPNQGGFDNGISNQGGFDNGVSNHGGFNNGVSSQGGFNNGVSNQGANKAYLPPSANRRGPSPFRRRQQPFNAKNGYEY